MATTIPAQYIGPFFRPELHIDDTNHLILDAAGQAAAATYGLRFLYIGLPASTLYPPIYDSVSTPADTNAGANTVLEGAAVNTPVGVTAHATSSGGFPITYSITADSSGGGFKVDATTGVVTVADASKINYETSGAAHTYIITVRANDGTVTSSQNFAIAVGNVAPTAPTDGNAGTNTVAEGAAADTLVGITATSTDINGPGVSYSLTSNPNGAFKIDSATGVVSVADPTKIDFEGSGGSYSITVAATDGTATTTQNFTINVTDLAMGTPVDSNNATNTVVEGAAVGTTVGLTAFAADPNGPATTYTLTSNPGGRFAIDSTTGVVTVASTTTDFESSGGVYSITVQAANGLLTLSQTFSIAVGNVAPTTPVDSNAAGNTVAEGVAADTLVGLTATSTDINGPGVTYSLTDNANGAFKIDSATGVVSVADPSKIDYENSGASHSYTITVAATDGTATGSQNFTINVTDLNEAPTATNLTQSLTVNEDGAAANLFTTAPVVADVDNTNVTATLTLASAAAGVLTGAGAGTPSGGGLVYTISGTKAAVNAALAAVQFDSAQDFNGVTSVSVAIDDGANGPLGSNPTGTVSITVNAVNDAPVNGVPGTQSVNEDTSLVFSGANAITISDVDAGAGSETVTLSVASGALTLNGTAGLAFSVGDGTADSTMTFSGTVAAINTALNGLGYQGNLNFNGTDTLNITTNDNGNTGIGVPLSDPDSVTINVSAVNDAPTLAATGNNPAYSNGADLFSGVTASTIESGQSLDRLVLTVTNVTGAATESLTIDGTTVALVNGTSVPTSTPGVTASVTVSGTTATVTITSTSGLSNTDLAALVDALNYTNTNVVSGDPARVVTITELHDTGGTANSGVDTATLAITSTVNFNVPPTANDDAATATEAGGLNNSAAGTNPSGNVITATGPGDVADTDLDSGNAVTVVAAGTGSEAAPTGAGTVNASFDGLHGSLLINTDGSYTYTVNQSDAAVQALRLSTDTITDTFNYTIQDPGGAQDTATLTFTINGANDSPIAVADTPLAVEAGGAGNGTAGTNPGGNVLTNDTDVDSIANGETKTVQGVAAGTQAGPLTLNVGTGVVSANGYGTLNIASDGTYSYVVDNTNVAVQALRTSGQTLTDTFSYTMHDQAGVTSTTQVTITIQGANDNPTAVGDTASATEKGGVNNAVAGIDPTGNLLTNDTDPDSAGNGETKTVQGVESGNNPGNIVTTGVGDEIQGSYGKLTVLADGSYTYVVDQALTELLLPGDQPTDTFTYTMRDAAGVTSTATLIVTVNGANDLPLAVADTGSITEDAAPTLFSVVVNNDVLDSDAGALNTIAISGTVTASSADDSFITNGDATAAVIGNQIQVTLGADFQTLAVGETATVTVPYTLTGNAGDTSSSSLTVTVTGVNDGVVANDDGGSITEDAGLTTYNVRGNDVLDVDHTATNFITIGTVTATDAGGDGINGADVTASVTAGNDIQFTLGSDFQKLGGNESSTITINYTLHGDQAGDIDSATLTYTVNGVNDAPVAQDFTFNGASSAIGNTSLVLDNGTGTSPVNPAGPEKTISGNLLNGATDVDTASSSFSITAETVSNAAGSITYTANGDFTFMPAAGFTGNAVFNYTLNDNDGSGNASDVGQVTINVATPKVWYVDASAGAGGDGTSDNPFNSFTQLNGVTGDGSTNDDVDGPNDTIFVYGGTYTGGIVLEDGQTLISQSQGLTVNSTALVAASGANATINGAVVLASGNTIDGINFGNSGSASVFALSGTNVGNAVVTDSSINNTSGGAVSINGSGTGMNLQFTSVSSAGASTSAILLQETQGTFNAAGGTLNNGATAAADVRLVGNSTNDDMAFTYGGSINDDQGQLVQITGQSGGTKSFSGTITDGNDGDGAGIDLNVNTGATINFTGGLTLSTSGVTAFNATGGGTVSVTGSANTINSGNGTALNISNTNIGANDVTFRSISSSGGSANGIILDTTGAAGGLHVTGTGTAGSGGTIASKGGADGSFATQGTGIYLNATSEAEFAWMQLNDLQNFGIRGNNVTGFKFDNSAITGTNGNNASGGTSDEAAISFTNLLGNASISNSNIANGFEYILKVLNSSGTLNRLTIDNTDFGTNNNGLGGDAVQIAASNTATVNVTVTDSSFTNAREDLFNAIATQSANMDVVFRDNTLSNNHTNRVSAASNILVFSTSTGTVTYDISHNASNTGATGTAIAAAKGVPDSGSGGTMTGTINANTIGVEGVSGSGSEFTGIYASALGSGTHTTAITNNVVREYGEEGILLIANDNLTGGNSVLNATVTGNLVTDPDANFFPFAGLWVVAGSGSGTENNVVNLVLGNNSAAPVAGSPTGSLQNDFTNGDPSDFSDVFLQESGSNSVINLSRAGSGAGTAAAIIQDDNVGTPTVTASGTINLVNTLPPTPPPVAPLMAAMGGVQASTPTPGETHLSQAQLDSAVTAAIAQWAHAGANSAQLAKLSAVVFTVADLSGNTIGDHTAGHIVIDADAAGHGWFVDTTPNDNSEFAHADNAAGTDLSADPTSAAAGHLDLLTAVMHEMGHELGLDHTADAHDLMQHSLVDGERRLPTTADAAGADGTTVFSFEHVGATAPAPVDNFAFAQQVAPAVQPQAPAANSLVSGDAFDFSGLASPSIAPGIVDASAHAAPDTGVSLAQVHDVFAMLYGTVAPGVSALPAVDATHAGESMPAQPLFAWIGMHSPDLHV